MEMDSRPDESDQPTRLNAKDRSLLLEVSLKYRVKYVGSPSTEGDEASVRADKPVPVESSVYYFEATIVNRGGSGRTSIGLMPASGSLGKLPGMEPLSIGYTDDGCAGDGTGFTSYGPTYTTKDVVGCCINYSKKIAFFTKNGNHLGDVPFEGDPLKGKALYPAVGMSSARREVMVNFGQEPFVFNIDHYKAELRASTRDEILRTELPDQTPARLHEMVMEYLEHMGYLEAAKEFARSSHTPMKCKEEDIEKRQVVRKHILSGEMEQAVASINDYFPDLLQSNSDLAFKLRCRQFVERVLSTPEQTDETLSEILGMGEELYKLSKRQDTASEENDKLFEEATSLLAFADAQSEAHQRLADPRRRSELADTVNTQLLAAQSCDPKPMLLRVRDNVDTFLQRMREHRLGLSALLDVEDLLES